MARLAEIPYGKFTAFITRLSNAGLTAELADLVMRDSVPAQKVVAWLRAYSFGNWSVPMLYAPIDSWVEIAPGVEIMKHSHGISVRKLELGSPSPEDLSIMVIALPICVHNTLNAHGIHTLGTLATWAAQELLNLRGCGIEDVNKIKEGLAGYGLYLVADG